MRLTALLLLLGTTRAFAQPEETSTSSEVSAGSPVVPTDATAVSSTMTATSTERATLPKGRVLIRGAFEINLSKEQAGEQISFSPDVWYGVDDKITVGLVHSFHATTGVMGGFGSSLCFAGDSCGDIYNGVGIDGRYHLKDGASYAVAANAGIYAAEFDPFQLAIKLGAIARWRPSPTSKLAVDVTPNILFGLTEREPEMPMGGGTEVQLENNKETIALPVTAWYTVIPKLSLGAQLAFVAPLETVADDFVVPISLGVSYQISERILVDAAFSVLSVVGGSKVSDADQTGFNARSLTIGGSYAL